MSQSSPCATSPSPEMTRVLLRPVPLLFSEQAAATPSAVALRFGDKNISFAELEDRSSRIANYLRGLGVGKDKMAGICLKRSPDFVIAALAVLKAGGAYVPLDPSYPADRLAFMVRDCQPDVVITRGCMASPLSAHSQRLLDLDELGPITQFSNEPVPAPSPDGVAYVIYTSGSTGTPKGVEVTHANLSSLVNWHITAFKVTIADRATQLASIGFDAAVWELWPNLCAGAGVYIPDEDTRNSAVLLRDWLVENTITISFVPTPLAQQMLALDWPDSTPLRLLLTGGDVLHQYPRRGLPFVLVNNYGPTECTVVATSGAISPQDNAEGPPDIGRPISNTRVLVVDENMNAVEDGTPGELCIGGVGVGRGYLNRAELTAEKFVPDKTTPGARLYRTGDLVRCLPDGRIVFLGRIDEQIKVRGFRIEPNEVVAALNCHPTVRESVVTVSADASGEKRLLAYVVPKDGAALSDSEIRDHLKNKLPEYMVPSLLMRIDELPLTANKKVDRSALPPPDPSNIIRDEVFSTPRNLIQQQLAALLSELLNVQDVGLNDNFFLLGGHSLLGAQLIARVRDAFAVELSLRKLFDSPTVAGLSAEIEQLLTTKLAAMSQDEFASLHP